MTNTELGFLLALSIVSNVADILAYRRNNKIFREMMDTYRKSMRPAPPPSPNRPDRDRYAETRPLASPNRTD